MRGRYKRESRNAGGVIDGPNGCGRLIVDINDENAEHYGESVEDGYSSIGEDDADLR